MKKVDYSLVSTTLGQRFKSGTLELLQTAPKEVIQAMISSQFGIASSNTNAHVLYGCVNVPAGGFNVISAGVIYYNGEIYFVPASTTIPDPPVTGLIAILVSSPISDSRHDPTSFTDGSSSNVHFDNTIQFADGNTLTSGYIADFANLVYHDWKTYVPTLSANDGVSVIPGGFTGNVTGRYKIVNGTLFIRMQVTNVATLNTVKFLGFSLPADFTIPTSFKAEGFNLCKYFDGSAYTTKQAMIDLNYLGAGTALEVSSFNAGFFASVSGGTIDFSIAIGLRHSAL